MSLRPTSGCWSESISRSQIRYQLRRRRIQVTNQAEQVRLSLKRKPSVKGETQRRQETRGREAVCGSWARLYPILVAVHSKGRYITYLSSVANVSRRFSWHKTVYWLLVTRLVTWLLRLSTWHWWLGCLLETLVLDSRLLALDSILDSWHWLRPIKTLRTRSLRLGPVYSLLDFW